MAASLSLLVHPVFPLCASVVQPVSIFPLCFLFSPSCLLYASCLSPLRIFHSVVTKDMVETSTAGPSFGGPTGGEALSPCSHSPIRCQFHMTGNGGGCDHGPME